jgi:hypothetical protein
LWTRRWTFRFHKRRRVSWLARRRPAVSFSMDIAHLWVGMLKSRLESRASVKSAYTRCPYSTCFVTLYVIMALTFIFELTNLLLQTDFATSTPTILYSVSIYFYSISLNIRIIKCSI